MLLRANAVDGTVKGTATRHHIMPQSGVTLTGENKRGKEPHRPVLVKNAGSGGPTRDHGDMLVRRCDTDSLNQCAANLLVSTVGRGFRGKEPQRVSTFTGIAARKGAREGVCVMCVFCVYGGVGVCCGVVVVCEM